MIGLMVFTLAGAAAPGGAVEGPPMDAGRLAHALDRLGSSARVLYVAAHPDDENTRLLTYLANGRHVTTAYLSMTRGGGGQNLIGGEQDELLDVIRTEELLAARGKDGAEQRFSLARDFGYSKRADETLALWGHEQALADVVWVMRTFQPDVVIARFDEKPPNHGHHTASAILAREAFAAAADKSRFPEQLSRGAAVWQATRLVQNLSPFREGPVPEGALSLDVGAYDARFGMSYGELAALSRSQHKSQGFGVAGERGPLIERFVHVAGTPAKTDILDGVELGWRRYGAPAAGFAAALAEAQRLLERDAPERALPALAKAHAALDKLPDDARSRAARSELEGIVAAAAGLFLRARAERPFAAPGGKVPLEVEVVARRPVSAKLLRLRFPDGGAEEPAQVLGTNEKRAYKREVGLPGDAAVSMPYWLAGEVGAGRYAGLEGAEPRSQPALTVLAEVELSGRKLRFELPVVYTWTDRVHGERLRPFLVAPPATVTPTRQAFMFPNGKPAPLMIRVRAFAEAVEGSVRLELPAGWKSVPAEQVVRLAQSGDEQVVRFEVTPAPGGGPAWARPSITVAGRSWEVRADVVDYPHIPYQTVLRPSRLRLVPLELKVPAGRIGYVMGSGDSVAEDLVHVGAAVELLDDDALLTGDLSRFAAVVLGIRAYNTRRVLPAVHERLVRYVEQGGTLVVQYNTSSRFEVLTAPVGPFPLTVGRDRVTDETAAVLAVDAASPLLTAPNRLAAADWEGWVQERGLYFATSWDARYQPLFKMADPGEEPLLGSTLVAKVGKGRYVYTGLALFRQLPAGVPGAYRLLSNLLAPEGRRGR